VQGILGTGSLLNPEGKKLVCQEERHTHEWDMSGGYCRRSIQLESEVPRKCKCHTRTQKGRVACLRGDRMSRGISSRKLLKDLSGKFFQGCLCFKRHP
jgi:hypothetical protein